MRPLGIDFDGDGRTELLTPTTDRDTHVAVRCTDRDAAVTWRQPLDGTAESELADVSLAEGATVGVGTSEGITVWQR